MFAFLKDAMNELSHVVWPTKRESRTYMYYTVGVIVTMTIILSIIGIVFKEILGQSRNIINPTTTTQSSGDVFSDFGLENPNIVVSTGSTDTATNSGTTTENNLEQPTENTTTKNTESTTTTNDTNQ